ncbi:WD repeat-containing protein [Plasmodium brasilianum]|uniref:WD repeat-containing protein n=1 Tax=Plasmodium brasilianum TaxID=5824 RepID=A0ACB9Y8Q8_PLABR|nr:WD repeat-containing protein [Plasmodium brasilianum]
MIECKRICVNHGIKAICVLENYLIGISFGNVIKIVNVITTNILLEYVVSSSSNIYGLVYKRIYENKGILVAHGVHKIYFYILTVVHINKCHLKLLSKYCTNKWILTVRFLQCDKESCRFPLYDKRRRLNGGNKPNLRNSKQSAIVLCLSNGSVLLVNIYKGISLCKYKFKGIHLLYSADIYIKANRSVYRIDVAGGTPFNKILLWSFKIKKNKIVQLWDKNEKKTQKQKTHERKEKKENVSLKCIQELSGHRGIIFKVKFFRKGKYIGSVSDDREGRIWLRARKEKGHKKRKKIREEQNSQKEIYSLKRKLTPNITKKKKKKKFLLPYYQNYKILGGHGARIWDLDMGTLNRKTFFITCSEDSSCHVYSKKHLKGYLKFCNDNGSTVRCICFHEKLGLIISGTDNGTVHIRSMATYILNDLKMDPREMSQANMLAERLNGEVGTEVGADVGAEVDADVGAEVGADVGAEVDADVGAEVGADVGAEVDADVGAEVGADVGADVGAEVGADVGEDVGADVGLEVGEDLGEDVGADVGLEVGEDVGEDVGVDIGVDVGVEVGEEVGADVGLEVGEDLGEDVGADVGLEVGEDVGEDVGADVGLEVGEDVGEDVGVDIGEDVGADVGTKTGVRINCEWGNMIAHLPAHEIQKNEKRLGDTICPFFQNVNSKYYYNTEAKNVNSREDLLSFQIDDFNEILKKNNDWIRSIYHINIYDILISSNFGCLYILKAKNKKKVSVQLIYEEKKKNYLLTCLTFYGLNYICLGFSNGFCCFIFLKKNEKLEENESKLAKGERREKLAYFKCFSHRISEMCLIPLPSVSLDKLCFPRRYKNVEYVLYASVKKDNSDRTSCRTGSSSSNGSSSNGSSISGSSISGSSGNIPSEDMFRQVVYNHEREWDPGHSADPSNRDHPSCKGDQLGALPSEPHSPVHNFILCNFDHTGSVKLFSVEDTKGDIRISNVVYTYIDVKNKKSKIISVNYVMRQKKKKIGILLFIGDEYGCIFVLYITIPILIKLNEVVYNFQKSIVKSKDKLRVHSNRKVFDIKIIDGYIYSCGQNGHIVKYQLYKDTNHVYTLYKLCTIKMSYYSSIYKLLPLYVHAEGIIQRKNFIQQVKNNDVNKKEDYPNNRGRSIFSKNNTIGSDVNIITQDNNHYYSNEKENLHNIYICCFKEKKFVLYDLKNKTEYLSVYCGGFRRPLSIFMKPDSNFIKTFSLCFCKEKNIYMHFKKLNSTTNTIVPYEQIYMNSGFHVKNVSYVLWMNKNYLCTCSEDGMIKVIQLSRKITNMSNIVQASNHFGDGNAQIDRGPPIVAPGVSTPSNGRGSTHQSTSNSIKGKEGIPHSKVLPAMVGKRNCQTKLSHRKETKSEREKNRNGITVLNHKMAVIQNIYNHNEPIFYICFLKNPFYYSKKLKFIVSVGAKNSVHVFYMFTDIKNVPVIYHLEKLKTKLFLTNNTRFLCVQGIYKILSNITNKYIIVVHLFIGTSIGYIIHYSAVYQLAIHKNIVISKILKPAYLVASYNLRSTILCINLSHIYMNIESLYSCNDKLNEQLEGSFSFKTSTNGYFKALDSDASFEKIKNRYYNVEDELVINEGLNHLPMRWTGSFPDEFPILAKENLGQGGNETEKLITLTEAKKEEQTESKSSPGPLRELSYHYFVYKKKIKDQYAQNILCCGLNNGKIFSCGDDQSINILVMNIVCNTNNTSHDCGQSNITLIMMQNTNFSNAHLSSIRSMVLFSNFLLSVSWDQYIYVWEIKREENWGKTKGEHMGKNKRLNERDNRNKNRCKYRCKSSYKNIVIQKRKQVKIAVYDVSCLNAFVIKKKEKMQHFTKSNCVQDTQVIQKTKNDFIDGIFKRKRSLYFNVYLSVAGTNGSLELFYLKNVK